MSEQTFSRAAIETAYCFFHQKWRVYRDSTIDRQQDEIEQAIGGFVATMNPSLYAFLAEGREDFLHRHDRFADHLSESVDRLEALLFSSDSPHQPSRASDPTRQRPHINPMKASHKPYEGLIRT